MIDMKQLKRVAAIGGAVSIALCWPLAVGSLGQNAITDGIANFHSGFVTSDLVHYDRGYLSSTVETLVTVTDQALVDQLTAEGYPNAFTLITAVNHGLFGISTQSTLKEYSHIPLKLNADLDVTGKSTFALNLAKWTYHSDSATDPVTVEIEPAVISGTMSQDQQADYVVSIPSVRVTSDRGEQLQVSGITGHGNGSKPQGFWLGDGMLNIAALEMKNAADESLLTLENLAYSMTSSVDQLKSRYTSTSKITLQHALSNDGEISNAVLNIVLGDVDNTSLETLAAVAQSAQAPDAGDKVASSIDELFARGFYFNIDPISFEMKQAPLSLSLKLAIPEGTDNVTQNVFKLNSALTGSIDLSMAKELTTMIPELGEGIDELVVQEMAVENDTDFSVKATIKEGNIEFANGLKVPLFAALMPLMNR
jgi:uncharacterized protein YdgA (DUF945 family)